MSLPAPLLHIHNQVKTCLYQEAKGTPFAQLFEQFEANTSRTREELVYGLSILIAFYLSFGSAAQFVCNLIGLAYPAYRSIIAVETPGKVSLLFFCCAFFELFYHAIFLRQMTLTGWSTGLVSPL